MKVCITSVRSYIGEPRYVFLFYSQLCSYFPETKFGIVLSSLGMVFVQFLVTGGVPLGLLPWGFPCGSPFGGRFPRDCENLRKNDENDQKSTKKSKKSIFPKMSPDLFRTLWKHFGIILTQFYHFFA